MTAPIRKYKPDIKVEGNGRLRKATVRMMSKNKTYASGKADLDNDKERDRLLRSLGEQLRKRDGAAWTDERQEAMQKDVIDTWYAMSDNDREQRRKAEEGHPDAAPEESVVLLDAAPPIIRRPLSLIGGRAYAAVWPVCRRTVKTSLDPHTGALVTHNPPLVVTEPTLAILRDDGQMFSDCALPGGQKLSALGVDVRLPSPLTPGREWSGAGIKRFCAGETVNPAEVFERVKSVVDRFLDFDRSLASQQEMCEMTACYVLSTYFVEAFNVVGYLWPNGEGGAGKTKFLEVVCELAYLGQVILAGSSYPCLRDMADYGATLAFDDAEAVMDIRKTDPDKRTLLLAGSRRGATIAVKELVGERWETRYVNAFCPRLFSAIRLPDTVLASRTIIIPLIRSGDKYRADANPLEPQDWPTPRQGLLDDLWSMGLAHLPLLPKYDRLAANVSNLSGRNLDPWRPILAVAAWLEAEHGVPGLVDRMEKISASYQSERGDIESPDRIRILFRALLGLTAAVKPEETAEFWPGSVAESMNAIATAEGLVNPIFPNREFISANGVGWLLKRQRFKKVAHDNQGSRYEATRGDLERLARAYGVGPAAEGPQQ